MRTLKILGVATTYTNSQNIMDHFKNNRARTLETLNDLTKTKNYHDKLDQQSGLLYFHTFGHWTHFFRFKQIEIVHM